MDVVFVLDETLPSKWLRNVKLFIGGLGDDMHIDPGFARSAIVPYGTEDASVRFIMSL